MFDKRADKAAVKELTTLHVMNTWMPNHMYELLREQGSNALSLLIFIKEKWDETVKGRACVDGSPQQKMIPKESATLPNMTTKSVFLTCLISAFEKRGTRQHESRRGSRHGAQRQSGGATGQNSSRYLS